MARSQRGKRIKTPSTTRWKWPKVEMRQLRRGFIAALWLIGLSGLGYLWVAGLPRLDAYASSALARMEITIELAHRPGWLHDELAEELKTLARRQLDASPFDREGLIAVHRTMELTGWYEDVARVERVAPDRVVITGRFRLPFALIRDRDGSHLVDRDGWLLPVRYDFGAEPTLLPILRGSVASRPGSPGERWLGPDVRAGLDLAELLTAKPWFDQVAQIDLAAFSRTEMLWIETTTGSRLLWGRAPGEEFGAEVPASQKLLYLDTFHRDYQRIDRGMSSLDISQDKVYATP